MRDEYFIDPWGTFLLAVAFILFAIFLIMLEN